MTVKEEIVFTIHADLFEDRFGELAIAFPEDRIFREVGTELGANFLDDALEQIRTGNHPVRWQDMTRRELESEKGWRCISRLGFINGDDKRPAIELEVRPVELGEKANKYLRDVL